MTSRKLSRAEASVFATGPLTTGLARWLGRGSGGRSGCAPPPSGSSRDPQLQAGQQGPAPDAGAYLKRSLALGGRQQSKLAAPPLGLNSFQVAPALSSLRS